MSQCPVPARPEPLPMLMLDSSCWEPSEAEVAAFKQLFEGHLAAGRIQTLRFIEATGMPE